MPHNVLSRADLDREYPSLEAVNDLELDDLTRLEDDQLYAAGMRVVQTILHEMSVVGRIRRAGTDVSSEVACNVFNLGKLDANKPRRSHAICPHG